MTTHNAISIDIKNLLDFLVDAELALHASRILVSPYRVTWAPRDSSRPFMLEHGDSTVAQYLDWLDAGAYSAVLLDGSLLQLSYDFRDGEVVRHRLAFVPCPFDLDGGLLAQGHPVLDVIELVDAPPLLRSVIRFDYDIAAAREGHPAAHLTVTRSTCRIACLGPMHAHRFADFVFRQFYPEFRAAHDSFFQAAETKGIGAVSIGPAERRGLHLSWDWHALASGARL